MLTGITSSDFCIASDSTADAASCPLRLAWYQKHQEFMQLNIL